ncbi:MAG: DnaB-like helicase C-terminal domain-containing protein [Pseudomonadota bacterium]
MAMHEKHKLWVEARGLDPQLAEKFGLQTRSDRQGNWLAIPYREGGKTINHKYRLTSEKQHRMDPDAPLALWNADALKEPEVREGQAPLVITEGEWDALAVIQAGHPFAVSVPNGAPSSETTNLNTAKRYDWVDRHAGDLAHVREFVLAADNDEAGHFLRTDLVSLLGADRCKFVEYPEDCKDLNEVLAKHGSEAVVRCLTTAKPFPVKGLYRLDEFPERGKVRSFDVGVEPIRDMISLVPGTLTVMTGYANMGKSTLMNAIIGNAISNHFPVCVASFETDVKPILRDGIMAAVLKCGPHQLANHPRRAECEHFINENVSIITQAVDEDLEMDIDEFLNICRAAVTRRGAKMIVLDPWNELEHKRRRDETETDYIGRAIRAIKRFAKQYDVCFWIVAHPTKPHEGSKKIPGLYDISGSANWANKPDYGLTYHRPKFDENRALIVVNKVRMGMPGKRATVPVTFDFRTSEFREAA